MNNLDMIAGSELKYFYVIGGTLQRDAASYVRRRADDDLYDGLKQGRFCYVLTSRQMGKSSLMVRTAARLREAGHAVVVLDLTGIGQNLSAEQWYDGLVLMMGQQLGLENELDDFWFAHKNIGPLQRWLRAIREVVLKHSERRVTFFVDEIDVVRSLPFSTDEFFAGIRELYNERTVDAELERLAFCLLGVATPSDLIRDTRTTPFNIGQRIELSDFTETEAQPLAFGLGRAEKQGEALLQRVLYWTGGHPYLTQRLCLAVAKDAAIDSAQAVDDLCEELFLSPRARERDDNLLFVRERMLRSEVDLAGLLGLYEKVHRGQRIRDDETNPLISVLRLSGITRVDQGWLKVRNRIYEHVFDRAWADANLPDAEIQRQRAAFRRGVWRTAAVAAIFLAAVSALTIAAVRQKTRADETAQQLRVKAQELTAALGLAEDRQDRLQLEQQRLMQQQELTEEQRLLADERRIESEEQQQLAEQQRTIAFEQRGLAEEKQKEAELQKTEAERQRGEAETQRNEAERQRTLVESEREKIETEERNVRNVLATVPADGKRKVLDYYQQVIELMRERGDRDGEASTLIRMGSVSGNLSERARSLEYFNQALAISREQGNKTLEARALAGVANVQGSSGDRKQAIELYQQAWQIWSDLGVRTAMADTLGNMGKAYGDVGENQKGLDYLMQSLNLSKAIGDRRGEAEALHDFGTIYYSMGERQKALEYFEQGMALSQTIRDKRKVASALGNIGVIYRNLGQPQKALENYNRALPLWRELGSRRDEAVILNNIGMATSQLGDKQKAGDYFNQALKIHQDIGDRIGEGRTLNNLGGLADDLGNKKEALAWFLRALPIRKAVNDLGGEANTHINIGKLYSEQNEYQQALDHLTQAGQIMQKIRNRRAEANTLNEIGRIQGKLGDRQKAMESWNRALAIWREIKDEKEAAVTQKLISEMK